MAPSTQQAEELLEKDSPEPTVQEDLPENTAGTEEPKVKRQKNRHQLPKTMSGRGLWIQPLLKPGLLIGISQ